MVVESFKRTMTIGETTCNYWYRLVRGQVPLCISGDKILVQTYGIEIERQDYLDDSLINIERDCISTISPQRHKIHNLLKMLYDNQVSPIHLVDVLGEYVDEYIIDFDSALENGVTNNI
jgi:protein tyrosine phosphatase